MSAFDQRVCEWLNTATIPPNKKQTVLNRVSVSISNYRALEIDKAHPAAANPAIASATSVTQTPRTPGRTNGASSLATTPGASTSNSNRYTPARSTLRGGSRAGLASPLSPARSAAGGFTVPQLEVDYSLQQRIAKALRRIQEGDEGNSENPLFPYTFTHQNDNVHNNTAHADGHAFTGGSDYEEGEMSDPRATDNIAKKEEKRDDMFEGHDDEDGNQPFGRPDNETGLYTVGFTFGDAPDDQFVGTHNNNDDENDNNDDDNTMTDREDARRRLTMKRKSRNAISAETIDPEAAMAFSAEIIEKDPKYRDIIISSLETHHLFSHLDDDDLAYVADIMSIHTFAPGENIVTKLEPCDDMYIIVDGEAVVVDTVTGDEYDEYTNKSKETIGKATAMHSVKPADSANSTNHNDLENSASSPVRTSNRNGTTLGVGKTLGDLGLMYHTIQPETVDAAPTSFATSSSSQHHSNAGVICCSISRNAYKNICAKASKIKRERYEGFLANVKFLQGLEKEERLRLADALKSAKYAKGEKIIKYGEEGVWFNIILDGRVDVIGRDANGAEVHVCSFKEGDSVGELEFIFGHKTVADCVAATPIVKTAKMTSNHFEKVIGPAKEVLESRASGDTVYSYYRQTNKVK